MDIKNVKLDTDANGKIVLPIPFFQKSVKYVDKGLKTLLYKKTKKNIYKKIKSLVKSENVRVRKLAIYLIWLFISDRYPQVGISASLNSQFIEKI